MNEVGGEKVNREDIIYSICNTAAELWPPGKVGTTQTLSQREQNAELKPSRYLRGCHFAWGGKYFISYLVISRVTRWQKGQKENDVQSLWK